jgi:hypothetical protein
MRAVLALRALGALPACVVGRAPLGKMIVGGVQLQIEDAAGQAAPSPGRLDLFPEQIVNLLIGGRKGINDRGAEAVEKVIDQAAGQAGLPTVWPASTRIVFLMGEPSGASWARSAAA